MTEDSRLEDIMAEYRFLQIINTPWKELSAYKFGIISSDGKILKKRSDLTETAEKTAYPDKFYTLTWTTKRLLEKFQQIPNSSSALIKTVWSLKTGYGGLEPGKYERIMTEYFSNIGINIKAFVESENYVLKPGIYSIAGRKYKIKNINPIGEVFGVPVFKAGKTVFTFSEAKKISEDGGVGGGPANSVGTGAIAGVSPGQEPPMPKMSIAAKRKKIQRRTQDRIKRDIQSLNIVDPA